MNPNLHHVRQLIGQDLVRQVAEITRDLNQQTDLLTNTLPTLVDRRLLRGIPARGGVITDQVIPGSDEHLEEMDTIRLLRYN